MMRFAIARMRTRRPSPTGRPIPERAPVPTPAPRSAHAELPAAGPGRALAHTLFNTLPGRLLVVSIVTKALATAVQLLTPLPGALRVLNSAASIGLLVALAYFGSRLVMSVKRRLLWRVRRKLILSYVFIGFVPTLLILAFFLFGGSLMFMNVCAYLFKDGYDDLVTETRALARETETEIRARGGRSQDVIDRRVAQARSRYADLAIALVPSAIRQGDEPDEAGEAREPAASGTRAAPRLPALRSGPWWHLEPPTALPAWLPPDGFAGTQAFAPPDAPEEVSLGIRVVVPPGGPGPGYAVIVDLPVTGQVIDHLYDVTGIRAGAVTASIGGVPPLPGRPRGTDAPGVSRPAAADAGSRPVSLLSLERSSVAFLDYVDWDTGHTGSATVSLSVRLGELYERISAVQGVVSGDVTLGQLFLFTLVVVAILFLVIEFVALVMGFTLARSITSSVHELFMGTERVREGDFTHRIHVKSRDQLGELADSFNQMTSSIEDLLRQAAEKKRLEEELRIAREIQMSLLPDGPLRMRGLTVAALCVPAREVGGDYYDFFPLGERRLGVLIADVAGKGTSAALYMAELKGLVLGLSQIWSSPRQLLIEANRILADNLASRAFITMTYGVLDLDARRMTYARAGHTPLIYVPGKGRGAQVLTPNGMVVGLRLPGAEEKFAELLEEQTLSLEPGDVILLYTDGISEAMNPESDLFGEARLSRIVEEHGHLEPMELRERILREVEAFAAGTDQHDDMTMILLKIEAADAPAIEAVVAATGAAQGGHGRS